MIARRNKLSSCKIWNLKIWLLSWKKKTLNLNSDSFSSLKRKGQKANISKFHRYRNKDVKDRYIKREMDGARRPDS